MFRHCKLIWNRFLVYSVYILLLTVGFSAQRIAFAQTADTLDANAHINVTVAGEPDISGEYTIDSNGDITMLYINQVHVKGLTVEAARKKITERLATVYRNPQVVVRLISFGGIDININGAVTNPGSHVFRSDAHLNDVIQLATPTLDADLSNVEITHGRPGETHNKDIVDYSSFLNDQKDSGNPLLKDGDVVYIRRKQGIPIQVNIRGEVAKPGRIVLPSKSTFVDAMQQAGGLTQNANRKEIAIQHSGSVNQINVDYESAFKEPADNANNPVLLDGDTIVVKTVDRPNMYTITGGVLRPGEYPLPQAPLTLADALGKAGGTIDRAKLNETNIVRTDPNGKAQKVVINASDPIIQQSTYIQAGDNIVVPPGKAPGTKYDPLQLLGVVLSVVTVFGRH